MYDLNDLEKKWKIYKKQKNKKIVTLGLSFALVAFASFSLGYFVFAPKNKTQAQSETKNTSAQNIAMRHDINQTQNIQQMSSFLPYEQPQKEIVIISPEEKKEEFKSLQPVERTQNVAQITTPQPQQQQQPAQAKLNAPPKITIKTKPEGEMGVLASRYNKNPGPEIAITLSEIFYKRGNYQKSLKWAINANSNSLDPEMEKSWILFAKSSYKLGKKQDVLGAFGNFSCVSGSEIVKTTIEQTKTMSYRKDCIC